MAPKLGEMLVREGRISSAQLDEALKSQVIFGGRLGTNLVELGFITEAELAHALGRKFGVPFVGAEQLTAVPAQVIQGFPAELAEKFRVIPLRLEGRRLTLAMADPGDLKAVDEIAFRTGFIVQPVIASDLRLSQAMESYYQIERKFRYIALAPEPHRPAAPAPLATAAAVTPRGVVVPEEVLAEAETIEEFEFELVTDETVARRLAEAGDRDDIATQVIAWLGHEYPRGALFLVRGEMALGWKAVVGRAPLADFEQLEIPLDEPSVLKTVAESKSYYLGPLARTPFNSMLLQHLGGQVPGVVMLMPLVMMGRVVAILYVDGVENPGERLFDLQKLVAKTSMAFDILVLKNKIMAM
jgi:hypothetical protein